jgi:integrase
VGHRATEQPRGGAEQAQGRQGPLPQAFSASDVEKLAHGLQKTRNRHLADVIHFAIATGMRRGELLSLTWRQIDLAKRTAYLTNTKNDQPRHVPLSPHAVAVLQQQNETRPDGLVFPVSANAVRQAWERLKRRAGIEDLRFHDLRHEAISRFFESGLTVPEVGSISGHKDLRMLMRYTHLRAENLAIKLQSLQANAMSIEPSGPEIDLESR